MEGSIVMATTTTVDTATDMDTTTIGATATTTADAIGLEQVAMATTLHEATTNAIDDATVKLEEIRDASADW